MDKIVTENRIRTYNYENNEIQRVQTVKLDNFEKLNFGTSEFSKPAFDGLCEIIEKQQIPKAPFLFGTLIFFHIPKGIEVPFFPPEEKYGTVFDKNIKAAYGLKKMYGKGGFLPENASEEKFLEELQKVGTLRVIQGMAKYVKAVPVSDHFGFMSEKKVGTALKANAGFFVMDSYDCASVYDVAGTPLGLYVKNGTVLNPPLYQREALGVFKGNSCNEIKLFWPKLSELSFKIAGYVFTPFENCHIFTRPSYKSTPKVKNGDFEKNVFFADMAIVGTKIVAAKIAGKTQVPAGGFVLRVCFSATDVALGEEEIFFKSLCDLLQEDNQIEYKGYEYLEFAVQAGNAIIKDGKEIQKLTSKFYNIKKPFSVPYPPSFYPLDFEKARAARMAIGADKNGKPVIIFAEGFDKIKHIPGKDSCGATLSNMIDYCREANLVNAVNLDGGGSAQILLKNKRSLMLSDRFQDDKESERGVPVFIYLEE